MTLSSFLTANIFVHIALAFYVAGFLTRNELLLRGLILCGTCFYILYYYFVSETPLWDAILASSVIGLANIVMITVILREGSLIGMNADMRRLFSAFPTLNPGQFRRIMRVADWQTATKDAVICEKDQELDRLFFVTKGEMRLLRDGRETPIPAGNFIGEISFLIGGAATADVIAPEGTQYVAWRKSELRQLMERSPRLSNALGALFNVDIARKLAVSAPDQSLFVKQ